MKKMNNGSQQQYLINSGIKKSEFCAFPRIKVTLFNIAKQKDILRIFRKI
jgi:hypothetical protein